MTASLIANDWWEDQATTQWDEGRRHPLGLFRPHAREFNDLGPLRCFCGNVLSEIGGRTGKERTSQIREPRFHVWVGKRRIDFPVEPVNDLGGRVLGVPIPSHVASLGCGITFADAASMPCRDENEVRAKANALGLVELREKMEWGPTASG